MIEEKQGEANEIAGASLNQIDGALLAKLQSRCEVDLWPAGVADYYLFTSETDLAGQMLESFPRPCSYTRHGREFAWQFTVPKRVITILLRRLVRAADERKTAA